MSKGETTVLGVNTSHDTAVAVVVDVKSNMSTKKREVADDKILLPRDDSSEGTMRYHTMKWITLYRPQTITLS